jgi:hypothetical protein
LFENVVGYPILFTPFFGMAMVMPIQKAMPYIIIGIEYVVFPHVKIQNPQ